MVAWIQSHQSLAHHPKTIRLANLLKCGVPAAIGHLHLLWYWALEYAQDGELAEDMLDSIAHACEWRGRSERFWAGLQQAGFVEPSDEGLRIHDWTDYAGRLIEQRAADAARSKRIRDAKRTRSEREPSGVRVEKSREEYAVAAAAAPVARVPARDGGGGGDFHSLETLIPDEVRQRLQRPPIEVSQC